MTELWAIEPSRLSAMIAAELAEPEARSRDDDDDDARPYEVRDGVAHISIAGMIRKRLPPWARWLSSSMTGAANVQEALRAAIADRDVRSILLCIDSPGGTVAGTQELAEDIFAARQLKPITAHVENIGASGAFWLAAQATRISANATAEIGSIGVYKAILDDSGAAEQRGLKVHLVRSGQLKGTGHPGVPVTAEQLAAEQENVDQMAAIFRAAVARGRGFDDEHTRAVAIGRTWIASDAQRLRLIDSVESAASAHAHAASLAPVPTKRSIPMPNTPTYASALAALPDDAHRAAVNSEIDALKKQHAAEIAAALAKAPKPEPSAAEKEAAAIASLPAEIRARLESEAKARADAEAKVAAHEKRIADLEEKRIDRDYAEKAAKYPHVLGLEQTELASVLKSAELGRPLEKPLAAKLEQSLAAMNAALAKSPLFAAQGSSNKGERSPGERLKEIAKELQSKDSKLTDAAAFVAAAQQNPGLYEELSASQRNGTRAS